MTRVTVVSPEPTPYRAPLFDRIAEQVDLTVIYAARTVAGRDWIVPLHHRSVFLRGLRVPGLRRALRHDYPVTPGIVRALRESRADVVVVSGWTTFASQAAVAWSRARRVPYVLHVESHDLEPRPRWRRVVKDSVARMPPFLFIGIRFGLASAVLAAAGAFRSVKKPEITAGALTGLALFGGSVQWISYTAFYREVANPSKNTLWCAPDSRLGH